MYFILSDGRNTYILIGFNSINITDGQTKSKERPGLDVLGRHFLGNHQREITQ